MTTKTQVMISVTDDDNVIVEGRVREGNQSVLKTRVIPKDSDVNTKVGEVVMSFAAPPAQNKA
jgi:hypothetical protein